MEEFISEVCETSSCGADLLVTAFVHAIRSYRRASTCTPFPNGFVENNEKDFSAVLCSVKHLPSIQELLTSRAKELPPPALKLLHWILSFRRKSMELVSNPSEEMARVLPRKSSPWHMRGSEHGMTQCLLPDFVIKVDEPQNHTSRFEEMKSQFGSVMGFHGTAMENLHSILRCGLLNLSYTEMQRNGSMFGGGIYFSTDPFVALGFSSAGNGWSNSVFGDRLRCILVCEIAKGDGVKLSAQAKGSMQVSSGEKHVNELGTYIVVETADLVKLRYVFLYRESNNITTRVKHQVRSRVSPCNVLLLVYALLVFGLLSQIK